jgi:EmrB/QacA subfamily drug resistance transporter
MALLDSTVVNVALPSLGRDLGASVAGLQWCVTGYVLTLAAFLLLGGSLGDRFGRRRVFLVGVLWFTAASVLCAAAPDIRLLVAARALQGVGSALMTPGSLALLSATLVPEDRSRAVGAWAGLSGAATALGPLLGGYLVTALSWRWVFWINVPLAVVVLVLAVRSVPESSGSSRGSGRAAGLDVLGAVLCAVGLAGLTFALISAPERGADPSVVIAACIGVGALAAFIQHERRTAEPMLPLSLFSSGAFRAVTVVTFFVYAGLAVLLVFLALTLQQQAGFSPAEAGSATLPFTATMFAFSARVGALARRVGARLPLTVGPLCTAGGALLLTRIGRDTSYLGDVLPGILLVGIGMTLTVAPLTATALSTAPPGATGIASGISNAVARTAGLLAVAVAPLLVGLRGQQYQEPEAVGRAFDRAMLLCAALACLGALVARLGLHGGHRLRSPNGSRRSNAAPHRGAGHVVAGAGDPVAASPHPVRAPGDDRRARGADPAPAADQLRTTDEEGVRQEG